MSPLRLRIGRRIAAALLFLLPSLAAAQCQSSPDCAGRTCLFSSADSWKNGPGCATPPDSPGENWVINAGATMLMDTDTITTGRGSIFGTLTFDHDSAQRDPQGYRNLVLTAADGDELGCWATGSILLRASDRVRFDTRAGTATLAYAQGCLLDFRGSMFPTSVAAVDAADDDDSPCGNATPVGREWTITPADGLDTAKVGRRVIFTSGPLMNRHFEIAAVSPRTLTLCSHLADNLSLGERLTPRVSGGSAPGPGTAGHHATPAITAGNDACTGPGAPHACCLGLLAGTCTDGPDPRVGDTFEIVDDGTIDQAAGKNGWRFVDRGDSGSLCDGSGCSGSDPFPIVQYMNLSGFGGEGNNTGVSAASFSVRSADQFVPDFIGNNLHGFRSDYGIILRGIKNNLIAWNAFHDSEQPPGLSDNFCQLGVHQHKRIENGVVDTPAANVTIRNNVAWGTKECAIQVNDAQNFDFENWAQYQAHDIHVDDNLVFGGCVVTSNRSCAAIELNSCRNCEVRRNVCYDMSNVDHTSGSCIWVSGTASNDGSDVSYNWLVNGSDTGIRCEDDRSGVPNYANCLHLGVTGNYISHFGTTGGRGGRWFGNVVKNFGLDNPSGGSGLDNPIRAYGTYVGIDDDVAAAPVCTSSADRCGRTGIAWYRGIGNNGRFPIVASDLILGKQSENPGGQIRTAMDNSHYNFQAVADFNGTISHVTHDNRASGVFGFARTFDFANVGPSVPVTWTISDFLAAYKREERLVDCTTAANVADRVGNAMSLLTGNPVEGGGAVVGACSAIGTVTRPVSLSWANRLALDYSLTPGTPEYTAGANGTAMGARAFLFRPELIASDWAGALPFRPWPAPFSTGTSNADSDVDGVMDFLDTCPAVFNPSQYDLDGDGSGNDCDCAGADPSAWTLPGEATGLVLGDDPVAGGTTTRLDWTAPATGGLAASMTYDVIRSTKASDLVTSATCLVSGVAATTATETGVPGPGVVWFYVVRARDACGAGASHVGSNGVARPARVCQPVGGGPGDSQPGDKKR
ncbi:MAG TPA: right-handed parallel beta-helix repeat-containing protein [Candidatus Polarisedimenticolia bacterium]|nr:right-handed parallel beta-helix repeat-containing protein [Candidatus Polarisedimenticolia bacterium]